MRSGVVAAGSRPDPLVVAIAAIPMLTGQSASIAQRIPMMNRSPLQKQLLRLTSSSPM
jgi:hypothetical protein